MDIEQPDFHSRISSSNRAWLAVVLLAAGMLACSFAADPEPGALDSAVASTLTAIAESADPTATAEPPTAAATTPAPIQATDTTAPPAANTDTPAPTASNPTEESDGVPGVISGSLSYPSEQIPRLAVVFFNIDDGSWWWIGTAVNQASYQMTVPVGRYQVVAYAEGGIAGGYTAAVPCGLTVACTDHSLITVEVGSNARVNGIDVTDWYAPAGAFPAKPAAINYP